MGDAPSFVELISYSPNLARYLSDLEDINGLIFSNDLQIVIYAMCCCQYMFLRN